MTDRRPLRLAVLLFAIVAALMVLTLSGCSSEPIVPAEGEVTCVGCHTDRAMLQADLEADPMPEKVKAESEGEG